MSSRLVVRAPAKINLGLTVLAKRADGFHELETVMQQVSLSDYLLLEPVSGTKIELKCSFPELESKDNLVYRAALLLSSASGKELSGVRISLYKNIPIAAGLAGGSSDAAAALRGLNTFWQLGFQDEELRQMGAELGSDIPFCVTGGTCLARGRGELLERLPDLPFFWAALVLPPHAQISTADAYRNFDHRLMGKPDLKRLIDSVRKGEREDIKRWLASGFVNTLESAELPCSPAIRRLKSALCAHGLHPVMSGSGPSLFMLFHDLSAASQAARLADMLGAKAYLCWTL